MRRTWKRAACVAAIGVLSLGPLALAQDEHAPAHTPAHDTAPAGAEADHGRPLRQLNRPVRDYPRPELPPEDVVWAGVTVIVIGGLFLAAAGVGPFVRALRDDELPPTHSHDEPPGTSGHHGPGGAADTGHAHDHH